MDSTLLTVGIFGIIAILAIGMFVRNIIGFIKEARQPRETYGEPAPRPKEQPKKLEPKAEVKAKPTVVVQPGRRPAPKPVAAPAVPMPQPVAEAEPAIVETKPAAQSPSQIASATAAANDTAPTASAMKTTAPATNGSTPADTAKNAGRPPIRVQGPKEEDSKRIERIENVLAKHFEPQPVNDNHKADKSAG